MTSWLFPSGEFSKARLVEISRLVGKEHLVVDLSCRRRGHSWCVAINKWQTVTDLAVTKSEEEYRKLMDRQLFRKECLY